MMKVRKGFTLVELLIVIVIIGILAAAMMLSSGSATAAAEASNIISDLRSMKAAALMFYADSMEALSNATYTLNVTQLRAYMDNPNKFTTTAYEFSKTDGKWFVGFNMTNKNADVKTKLRDKANSTGVLGTRNAAGTDIYEISDNWAYMIAR